MNKIPLISTLFLILAIHELCLAQQIELKYNSKEKKIYGIISQGTEGEAVAYNMTGEEFATPLMDSFLTGIKSSFENRRAPYSGHITTDIDCVARKYLKELPVTFKNRKTNAVLAVANERKLAVCSLEQIKFISAYWTAFNKDKQLVFTVKLFMRIQNLDTVHKSHQRLLKRLQDIINQL